MGNLIGLIPLEDDTTVQELAELLAQNFGEEGQKIVLGPLEQQIFNDCLLLVQNLVFEQRGMLLSLLQGRIVYNIIIS